MEVTSIIIGLFVLAVLGMWIFAHLNDPKKIDREEEADVRAETPQEHERALFDDAKKDAERNQQDIEFYSPGDAGE